MFGHDDHDDEQQDEAVTVEPVTATDTTATPAPQNDAPAADITSAPEPEEPASAPASVTPSESTDNDASAAADPALLDLKKQALEELSPLVEHLDQTPEEKFKTTMMLIQATDSSNLISAAYQAAKDIPDEKVRAQALLDIVNEINYFTQK